MQRGPFHGVGGADMYPKCGTKGRGHRGARIKGFSGQMQRRRRTGVKGQGAATKKSQEANGAVSNRASMNSRCAWTMTFKRRRIRPR